MLAVARELKAIAPDTELIGICEKRAKFVDLLLDEPAIGKVYQVRAGKYRRYAGLKWYQRWFDIRTLLLNIRDVFRTAIGYIEARRLLKELKPDLMLVKGGFVAVPVGLAAARLKIPFITHDSDSVPGLANRIISRWAAVHATGVPKELYAYPPEKTVYTGIPVGGSFVKVTPSLRARYRDELGLGSARQIITVVGGSQGAAKLNEDMASIIGRLMQRHEGLGLVHIAGRIHEANMRTRYGKELSAEAQERVVVKGFVDNVHVCQGAADIVVSRASATVTAELSLQGLPAILVPGQLAGGHQDKNAVYLQKKGAALAVPFGDAEGLYRALDSLLTDAPARRLLGTRLHKLAKPHAARELAELVIKTARKA